MPAAPVLQTAQHQASINPVRPPVGAGSAGAVGSGGITGPAANTPQPSPGAGVAASIAAEARAARMAALEEQMGEARRKAEEYETQVRNIRAGRVDNPQQPGPDPRCSSTLCHDTQALQHAQEIRKLQLENELRVLNGQAELVVPDGTELRRRDTDLWEWEQQQAIAAGGSHGHDVALVGTGAVGAGDNASPAANPPEPSADATRTAEIARLTGLKDEANRQAAQFQEQVAQYRAGTLENAELLQRNGHALGPDPQCHTAPCLAAQRAQHEQEIEERRLERAIIDHRDPAAAAAGYSGYCGLRNYRN